MTTVETGQQPGQPPTPEYRRFIDALIPRYVDGPPPSPRIREQMTRYIADARAIAVMPLGENADDASIDARIGDIIYRWMLDADRLLEHTCIEQVAENAAEDYEVCRRILCERTGEPYMVRTLEPS